MNRRSFLLTLQGAVASRRSVAPRAPSSLVVRFKVRPDRAPHHGYNEVLVDTEQGSYKIGGEMEDGPLIVWLMGNTSAKSITMTLTPEAEK